MLQAQPNREPEAGYWPAIFAPPSVSACASPLHHQDAIAFQALLYTAQHQIHPQRAAKLSCCESNVDTLLNRYATNQDSPLVDEQKGEATLGHIMFKDGDLKVPKQKQNLQKLLSLYHPLKGRVYEEFSAVEEAVDQLDILDLQIDALNAARSMDVDQAEAILRVELGSKVNAMSSKELRRDLLLMAKENPDLFIDLANDDNVILRNFAIRSVEESIISLTPDNRSFTWTSNGRKLMNVPFDENPYSAMAAWFKTDEGVEVFKSIEKKLK